MSALSQTKLNVDQIRANDDTLTTEVSIPSLDKKMLRAYAYITYSGGTPTLETSVNVSSIVDASVGKVDVNFTAPMPDAEYGALANGQITTLTGTGVFFTAIERGASSASTVRASHFENGASADPLNITVIVFDD
ncbi:hypothetical protein NVP1077O_07 [Vibrio phage 1.077.O._10N.261.45.A10]|nr:hypothetical protein NVP1070O_07 [Vibrio phage 1.070.O._10N.261.45.B2]AUR85585.1 hypothetical protein NVP1077O_07 [Vibrio phage 1.077.O._10N.261.45.A10]